MKLYLLAIMLFYSVNSIACEKEFYQIDLDRANESIKVISNGYPDQFYSKIDNIKFQEGIRIHKRKKNLYPTGEEVYSYYISNNLVNHKNFGSGSFTIDITYPNGKKVKVFYEDIHFSKKENLDKLRTLPRNENIQAFLDPIEEEKLESDPFILRCVSTLRYYIEYNHQW